MTRDKFIWKIEHGDDIMFDVAGRHFAIFTWMVEDKGICICEQNVSDSHRYFQTAEDLIDNFFVGDTPLADLVEKIVITDYTLVKE